MNCMKCGREVEDGQVFCPKCMDLMAQNPVKPDVVIKLPQRQEASPKKALPRKKTRTPEEQITYLKKKIHWLTAVICFLTVLFLLFFSFCIDYFRQLDVNKLLGQNYSTMETLN